MISESAVVRAMRGFKAAVRAQEGAEIQLLAERYLQVERALEDNILALSEQVNALYAAGEDPTWSQLYRLERFQRLEAQLVSELARFNGWAAQLIKDHQWQMGLQAVENAAALLELSREGLGSTVTMPHEAIQALVGTAKNGAPLGDLLASSYPTMRSAITRELVRAVALGRNPRVTAAAIRRATGLGLDRALTIARTEQLRVYREASLESYRSAGITQYQRIAALDERTCLGCALADGEILSTEAEFSEHCAGRCDCVPLIPGVENPEWEHGAQWFERQPEAVQLSMMGPGRFEAYKSGVPLSEFVTHTHDATWGGAYVPTRVSDLPAAVAA